MTGTFSRAAGVLSAGLDGELVLYDPRSTNAHTLDADATRVWEALAEPSDLAALIERTGLTEDQVIATLARLAELGLLEAPAEQHNGVGRREVLRRGAMLAAAGVGLPTVASLAVPGLAAAASTPTTNPGGGDNGNSGKPTGFAIQQGPPPPPGKSGNSYKPKSANGSGYYAYASRNSKGYYANGGGGSFVSRGLRSVGAGSPVSNYSGYKGSLGGQPVNFQCLYDSMSEPCATYYAQPGGAAVCASYGSPYVCNGSH